MTLTATRNLTMMPRSCCTRRRARVRIVLRNNARELEDLERKKKRFGVEIECGDHDALSIVRLADATKTLEGAVQVFTSARNNDSEGTEENIRS